MFTLLLVSLTSCTLDRKVDPVSELRSEAFDAVRQSIKDEGSAAFENLPQQVMPTIGAVCGQVSIESSSDEDRQTRPFFYVRGQPVLIAKDQASQGEVADRCRRASTEVEEMKLLPISQ